MFSWEERERSSKMSLARVILCMAPLLRVLRGFYNTLFVYSSSGPWYSAAAQSLQMDTHELFGCTLVHSPLDAFDSLKSISKQASLDFLPAPSPVPEDCSNSSKSQDSTTLPSPSVCEWIRMGPLGARWVSISFFHLFYEKVLFPNDPKSDVNFHLFGADHRGDHSCWITRFNTFFTWKNGGGNRAVNRIPQEKQTKLKNF